MHPTRRRFLGIGGLVGIGLLAGCTTQLSRDDDTAGGSGTDPGTDSDSGSGSGDTDGSGGPGSNDGGDTDGPGAPGSDDGTDDAGGTRPEGTGGPGVTIVARDDPPAIPIRPSVEIEDEAATVTHPPRLRVTLTNTGSEALSVGEARAATFAYEYSTDDLLVLLPSEFEYTYPAERDCWRLEEPIAITEEYRTVGIEPGDSITRIVSVYGAPGIDGCLPVGEHRFETAIAVAPLGEIPTDGEVAAWGFSVLLE
jgi:hypothetical protein